MEINIVHFGDNCAPGIIINDILDNKEKLLFQLGVFQFNGIYEYLLRGEYELLFDLNYLTYEGKPLSIGPDTYNNHNHCQHVVHSLFNFRFNHDYLVDGNTIYNYNFIVGVYRNKIQHFKNIIANTNNFIYFICFTLSADIKLDAMVELLKTMRKNVENFKIIVYTFGQNTATTIYNNNPNNRCFYDIVDLDNNYEMWYIHSEQNRFKLYEEIYNKFNKITNFAFPAFSDTPYYRRVAKR